MEPVEAARHRPGGAPVRGAGATLRVQPARAEQARGSRRAGDGGDAGGVGGVMRRERGAANDNYSRIPAPLADAVKAVYVGARMLQAGSRPLPDFLVIGAQRCGTTSLYRYLEKHPNVIGASPSKGVHYFDMNAERSLRWYRAHFPTERRRRQAGSGAVTGEASPYYLFHPRGPDRVRAAVPDARLIAMLRDPVDRAYSQYQQEYARGFEDAETFERALELEPARLAGERERMLADPEYESPALQHHADLRSVARGGTLNFIGSVLNGLLQFLLVVIVTQALTKSAAGAFFEAVALFTILSNTCELGADTGLTRMIPRYRVHGRIADVRRSMAVGIAPAFAAGLVLSIVALVAADPLAAVFTNHRDADASRVATYIRVLAVFLPVSAAYTVAVAATRGFGTMLPNAVVDRIGRAFLQLAAIGLVLAAGGGALAVGLGWGVPIAASFAVALAWLARLIAATERSPGERQPPTAMRALSTEFWRFPAPRGLTGVFPGTILWVGTLLVGSLLDAAHASVYTASTRYLVAGSVVNMAIITAIAPKLSELLSGDEHERAREVYQVATCWLMTLAWPLYFTLAVFAPLLLKVFKPEYAAGASSLEVLAAAMLVATGIGPVDIVLLMGGRSFWNLFNVVVAL